MRRSRGCRLATGRPSRCTTVRDGLRRRSRGSLAVRPRRRTSGSSGSRLALAQALAQADRDPHASDPPLSCMTARRAASANLDGQLSSHAQRRSRNICAFAHVPSVPAARSSTHRHSRRAREGSGKRAITGSASSPASADEARASRAALVGKQVWRRREFRHEPRITQAHGCAVEIEWRCGMLQSPEPETPSAGLGVLFARWPTKAGDPCYSAERATVRRSREVQLCFDPTCCTGKPPTRASGWRMQQSGPAARRLLTAQASESRKPA